LDPIVYYTQKDAAEAKVQERRATDAAEDDSNLFGAIGRQFSLLSERMNSRTPIELVRKMENAESPQQRWQAIDELVEREFAKRAPYTDRYAEIAMDDPDYLVRAVAIRALNRSRQAGKTDVFIRGLNERSDVVRLEAAKALNNLPDPAAAPPLVALLTSDTEIADVRIAAAEALRHYKRIEVARALIAALTDRDFGVAWQARRSLHRLMETDLGYDQGKWLAYITGPAKPFG
jgi:HEAT repeat protein